MFWRFKWSWVYVGVASLLAVAPTSIRATEPHPFLGCINTLLDAMDGAVEREFSQTAQLTEYFELGALSLVLRPEQQLLSTTQQRILRYERALAPLYLYGFVDAALAAELKKLGFVTAKRARNAIEHFTTFFPTYGPQLDFLDKVTLRLLNNVESIGDLCTQEMEEGLIASDFAELKLFLVFELSQKSDKFKHRVSRLVGEAGVESPLPALPPLRAFGVGDEVFRSGPLREFLSQLKPLARIYFMQSHALQVAPTDQRYFVTQYPRETEQIEALTPLRLGWGTEPF